MKSKSLNSILLTTFVKNFRLGIDPQSLLKRHQTLSIIYINFSYILMTVSYEIMSVMGGIDNHHTPVMIFPFVIVSLLLLRNGKNDSAALVALLCAHALNAYTGRYNSNSMGSIVVMFMFPIFSFFMSSSNKLHCVNVGISILQMFEHVRNCRNRFRVMMNTEQQVEITNLVNSTIPCFTFLCLSLIAQKSVMNSIWEAASLAQEKNEKINHEIMQAVESKDAFISSLSHEIRNPLNAMSGSINYLLQVVHDRQLQQVLHNAKISGETLLVLFTNLLDAAKLKSEKMELYYSDTNLYETLKKVLIINCDNIKQKKIFVDVLVDQNIPQVIQSDATRLLQILMNLTSNAIKFTPEGGKIAICATLCHKNATKEELEAPIILPSLCNNSIGHFTQQSRSQSQLDISSLQEEDESLLTEEFSQEEAQIRFQNIKNMRSFKKRTRSSVQSDDRKISGRDCPWNIQQIGMSSNTENRSGQADQSDGQDYYLKIQITVTGCGIAEENVTKLFEMFTQAHKRITSSHGGTGLGLWICKQLCQKMGGDIKLYSKLNEGTSFVFHLPINHRNTLKAELGPESDIMVSHHSDKITCLVVDDLRYNRDLYKLLLEREGVQVVLANDGEEAINKYLANLEKLDFILMDVQMPKMDGFTAARKIRELEAENKWRRVDIYFVSGEYYNEEEVMASFRTQQKEDGRALGIQSLKKPIDIEVISKVAAKYTKKGR